ncbi:4-hydroxythreonine-4-phosphate dehydrogenase PdxA [Pendulispora albinea]|uniref:4-hydroxythreonine-4-phosphate dehydrogenase n=1 Tax=Pendulispora albinea TaxID=2741071 RepID=A0ABZ2LLF6_9BACT
MTRAPLAITMGDPAGIGPEIVAKLAASDRRPQTPFIVIGDSAILRRAIGIVGAELEVREARVADGVLHFVWEEGILPVLQTGPSLPLDLPIGKVDARAGAASYAYVERAIDLALAGTISGIVTAPINKEAMRAAGIAYPGHTEILADRSGTRDFAMMLANDELRVLLVSIHVSLLEAIRQVTHESELRAMRLAKEACRAFGIEHPRVAVAGLNPHAGENGLFGGEDRDVIAPAIRAARGEGIDASGPWPGDTIFMRARKGEFDVVVAQYHDQGLIPVKYLGLDDGVNVTVGLPFVRTSVDHGTAFDIAGTGRADPASLAYALKQAVAMVTHSYARRGNAGAGASADAGGAGTGARAGEGAPEFIFMLTRNDRTVSDARARLAEALEAGVRHIGFKDVGLPFSELRTLVEEIRAGGAKVYLEVVSLDESSEIASARAAVSLGVDVLMGGTRPESVLPILHGSAIHYRPFPGAIMGHPSVLRGTVDEIVSSAKRLCAHDGVHGLDLLAYRFDGDVEALIARVCAAVDKPVVIAGSIDRPERIAAVMASQAAAFTIGTAALDGTFPAAGPGLIHQLRTISNIVAEHRNRKSAAAGPRNER